MTLDELITLLEEQRETCGSGDIKVELQHQRSYPLKAGLLGITSATEIACAALEEEFNSDAERSHVEWPEEVVFIVASESTEYGDKRAWETARIAW